jgi:hypothetical protein
LLTIILFLKTLITKLGKKYPQAQEDKMLGGSRRAGKLNTFMDDYDGANYFKTDDQKNDYLASRGFDPNSNAGKLYSGGFDKAKKAKEDYITDYDFSKFGEDGLGDDFFTGFNKAGEDAFANFINDQKGIYDFSGRNQYFLANNEDGFTMSAGGGKNYEAYVKNNPDLLQSYNTAKMGGDTRTLAEFGKEHYETFGKDEGRQISNNYALFQDGVYVGENADLNQLYQDFLPNYSEYFTNPYENEGFGTIAGFYNDGIAVPESDTPALDELNSGNYGRQAGPDGIMNTDDDIINAPDPFLVNKAMYEEEGKDLDKRVDMSTKNALEFKNAVELLGTTQKASLDTAADTLATGSDAAATTLANAQKLNANNKYRDITDALRGDTLGAMRAGRFGTNNATDRLLVDAVARAASDKAGVLGDIDEALAEDKFGNEMAKITTKFNNANSLTNLKMELGEGYNREIQTLKDMVAEKVGSTPDETDYLMGLVEETAAIAALKGELDLKNAQDTVTFMNQVLDKFLSDPTSIASASTQNQTDLDNLDTDLVDFVDRLNTKYANAPEVIEMIELVNSYDTLDTSQKRKLFETIELVGATQAGLGSGSDAVTKTVSPQLKDASNAAVGYSQSQGLGDQFDISVGSIFSGIAAIRDNKPVADVANAFGLKQGSEGDQLIRGISDLLSDDDTEEEAKDKICSIDGINCT